MRKLAIISAFLLLSLSGFGQAIVGKMYTIVPDFIPVYGVDNQNKAITTIVYRASAGTRFSVTGFDSANNIKITFWRYGQRKRSDINQSNVTKFPDDKVYIAEWANYREFAITPEDFNRSCVAYFSPQAGFTWGVMTLPIKLRFGNGKERQFSYEEKLNLGFVAGRRQQIQGTAPQYINYLAGFSIANVRTDSLSQKSGKSPAGTSSGAFSVNIGAVYAYDNFQVGVFVGSDYIPGNLGRDWKYQGRPWIGLALGISLFSRNKTEAEEVKNE